MIAKARELLILAVLSVSLCVGVRVAETTLWSVNSTVADAHKALLAGEADGLATLHAVRGIAEHAEAAAEQMDAVTADVRKKADEFVGPKPPKTKAQKIEGIFGSLVGFVIQHAAKGLL
jgi:MinD-like ATPase involved in chromosome partitioning or flagellar assembly